MTLPLDETTFWAVFARTCGHLSPGIISTAFRDFREILEVEPSRLASRLGIRRRDVEALLNPTHWAEAVRGVEQVQQLGVNVLNWSSPQYPDRLRHIPDAPAQLYWRGQLPSGEGPAVAIVGSRRATPYGMQVARRMAAELAEAGVMVVSGGAKGIDAAAHLGALEAGGITLVIRGTGLDVDYPLGHQDLFRRAEQSGATLTELLPGMGPHPSHFPRRNRIISGWCQGVVVVEAGLRSGALSTARLALEHGREVFAVPGPVDSPVSVGPHHLLKQGAALVAGAHDVLEELGLSRKPPTSVNLFTELAEDERDLLGVLSLAGNDVEVIVSELGWSVPRVQSSLLTLELKGHVTQLPGGRVVLAV